MKGGYFRHDILPLPSRMRRRIFEILGTNYNSVKEAGYYSNAAVISPRANDTSRTNSYCILNSLKSIVLKVCKHGYGNANTRNYQSSPRSEAIAVLFFFAASSLNFPEVIKIILIQGELDFDILTLLLRHILILAHYMH